MGNCRTCKSGRSAGAPRGGIAALGSGLGPRQLCVEARPSCASPRRCRGLECFSKLGRGKALRSGERFQRAKTACKTFISQLETKMSDKIDVDDHSYSKMSEKINQCENTRHGISWTKTERELALPTPSRNRKRATRTTNPRARQPLSPS